MCRKPMGWCNRLRSKTVNIWDPARHRPDKFLCSQPYHETKFTRPKWLTKWGFPKQPRTPAHEIGRKGEKYCNMSHIHQQDSKRPFGLASSKSE
mmetsp:Transcript_101644/g.180223  ORF Transcript_101644/g.180223 Transcript_101644/m.180223 type:complete len:94 (-) Transcript_101644:47-328(-)